MFSIWGRQLKEATEGGGHGVLLKESFQKVVRAQEFMVRLYQSWTGKIAETKENFVELHQIMTKDASITDEYFGINGYFMAIDESDTSPNNTCFDQYLDLFETAIQMGNQLCVLMLEMLNDSQKGLLGVSSQLTSIGNFSSREVVESAQQFEAVLLLLEGDLKMRGYDSSSRGEHDAQLLTHTRQLMDFTSTIVTRGSHTYNNYSGIGQSKRGTPINSEMF